MKILICDDEPFFLLPVIERIQLRFPNLHIDTVSMPETAIEMYDLNSYDLIISDRLMPNIDGIKFLQFLRNSGLETPYVLFSIATNEKSSQVFYESGGTKIISKAHSDSIEELITLIASVQDKINKEKK